MKNLLAIIVLLVSFPVIIHAQTGENNLPETFEKEFLGEWTIDLRPSPDAEGYYQPFEVVLIEENSFKGTFYGSEIENALINRNWEKLYFAFSTRDLNSAYYHSGYLLNGALYGISYCPDRNFTAPWTGRKK